MVVVVVVVAVAPVVWPPEPRCSSRECGKVVLGSCSRSCTGNARSLSSLGSRNLDSSFPLLPASSLGPPTCLTHHNSSRRRRCDVLKTLIADPPLGLEANQASRHGPRLSLSLSLYVRIWRDT